jgi:hypothetical protein
LFLVSYVSASLLLVHQVITVLGGILLIVGVKNVSKLIYLTK